MSVGRPCGTRSMGSEIRRANQLPPPRRRFGQHFLRDRQVLAGIVDTLGDLRGRTVLEIGPGRGALTDLLVEHAERVVAVEIDRDLVSHLRARYKGLSHVEIIEADVLETVLADVAGGPFALVGNVPYYITTPIIFHALVPPRPVVAVFLVQKEVAERMTAAPGGKAYGALSVNLQALVDVTFIRKVPPGAFNPPPAVDSAVVRITPAQDVVIEQRLEAKYRSFVTSAFGLRRKQLLRVIRIVTQLDASQALEVLRICDLSPTARPETLTPDEFARIVRVVGLRETSD